MKQAEFAELSREVMPVLDKLTEIAGQHGTAEKLVSITLSAEGYIHFTVHDSGMCLSRLKREDAPELEIRKQLSQEMGREEMRWLSGFCVCRDCYKAQWESENHKPYTWDDLDGKRPTMEEFEKENE